MSSQMFKSLMEIYTHCNYDLCGYTVYLKYEPEILDIFNNGNTDKYKNNIDLILFIGNYYKNIKNYEKMKEYYLISIKSGNEIAMNNLGHYYQSQKKYKKMKIYYLKAIKKGSIVAMKNLSYYYQCKKKYKKMEKYYFMATGEYCV